MSRESKKENQGKKSKLFLFEPLINQRMVIMDLPQEVEDDDPLEEEAKVVDMEEIPKATRKNKIRNILKSLKSSATTVRRWFIFLMSAMWIKNERKIREGTYC